MSLSDEGRRKQNRGTGEKGTWIPWHFSSDFPGKGLKGKQESHMFPKRLLHGLSKTELELLYMIEISDGIEDFKEQFNLPLEETKKIAGRLGVKHPRSKDKKSEVMTIDVLIIFKDGRRIAIDVKYFSDDDWEKKKIKRMLEKLQISKIWCELNEIKWYLFTQFNVPKILITNVRTLRQYFHHEDSFTEPFRTKLLSINNSNANSVGEVNETICKELKIPTSRGWKIFKHLCARKFIRFNLNNPFTKSSSFNQFYCS